MNRTLRRPMFRIGGSAEGITSGLSRQGYQGTDNASDQRVLAQNMKKIKPDILNMMTEKAKASGQFDQKLDGVIANETTNDAQKGFRWPRGRNFNDFLISMGLDLVSRPKGGNIFQQVATSAKGPFEQFQARRAAQEDRDWKRKWEQGGRDIQRKQFETEVGLKKEEIGLKGQELEYEKIRDEADRILDKYLGEIKAKGKTQWIVEELEKFWDEKILAAEAEGKSEEDIAAMRAQKAKDKRQALRGYDVSDTMAILKNTAAFAEASDLARRQLAITINPDTGNYWNKATDAGYADELIKIINRYLLQIANFFIEEEKRADEERTDEAEGGRIGYQNAGAVMPGQPMQARAPGPTDQGETNQINISYEQLRERLPPEISNEIDLLLSKSYEAFADFAEIQTQADVNEFNTKYNVQLFLPKQSGA